MNPIHKLPWMFDEFPDAFAYHQILLDSNRKPIDYVFIQVNRAFEKMTGLKRETLLYKKVTEVLPTIKESSFDWISIYGEVALTGEGISFQEYSEPLKRWYQVEAYSKKKGFFVTIFRDITQKIKDHEELIEKELLQHLLLKMTTEFITIPLSKIHSSLNELIEIIGTYAKVDRVSIFKQENTQSSITKTHEWCADRIMPTLDNPLRIPSSIYKYFLNLHQRGEILHIPSLVEMTKEHTIGFFFKEQGLKSILLMPLMGEGKGIGFVSFESVKGVQVFQEMQIALLKALAGIISNIFAKQEADRVLQESEQKYRTIVENINDALYIHDFQGNMIDVNDKACQVMGYKREELLQLNIKALNSREVNHMMPGIMENLLAKGQFYFEGNFLRKDSSMVPGDVSAKVVSWEGDGIIQSFARDVTKRKKIEENLRKNEKDLSLTLHSIQDGVITTDREGRISRMNQVAEDLTGWTQEEAINSLFHEVFKFVEDKGFSIQQLLEKHDKKLLPKGTILYSRNGTCYQISGSASSINDEQNIVGVVVVFSNVTEQYQLQQELKEKQNLNHMILSSLPHPVMLIRGSDRVILSANKTAFNMGVKVGGYCWREFGKEQYISKEAKEFIKGYTNKGPIPKDLEICCVFCQGDACLLESQGKNNPELRMFDKIWDVHWIRVSEDVYLHYAIDITDLKQAERDLKDYATQLEEMNTRLDQEIHKAKQVHEKTLPKVTPEIEGLDLYAYYQPANNIGGDFYNFFKIQDQLLFYVSDVTGHDLDAAMMSAFVKNTISTYVDLMGHEIYLDPSSILNFLVRQFAKEEYPEDFFITILLGLIDPKKHTLTYSSAGLQVAPLLFHGGDMIQLPAGNLPISTTIPEDLRHYDNEEISILPGTTLLFSTDGLSEEKVGGQMYGEIYPSKIRENIFLPPGALAEIINGEFAKFSGEVTGQDDITYIILQTPPQEEYLQIDFQIDSTLEAVYIAKEKVTAFVSPYKGDKDMMMMVLHEMLINAVEHGNKFLKEKKVKIHGEVRERFFLISVEDEGLGFDWRKRAFLMENELDSLLEEKVLLQRRCLGSFLKKADRDYFYYYNEGGTKATFVIKRS